MAKFTDRRGKQWELDINVGTVDEVFAATNVSIYKLLDKKMKRLQQLLSKPAVLAHVCYVLSGAEAAGVSQRDFATGLKGDALGAATDAFLEELTLFFPDARRRAAIAKLHAAWRSLENKSLDLLAGEMEKHSADEMADRALMQLLSTTSGNSPASSDSTPGP